MTGVATSAGGANGGGRDYRSQAASRRRVTSTAAPSGVSRCTPGAVVLGPTRSAAAGRERTTLPDAPCGAGSRQREGEPPDVRGDHFPLVSAILDGNSGQRRWGRGSPCCRDSRCAPLLGARGAPCPGPARPLRTRQLAAAPRPFPSSFSSSPPLPPPRPGVRRDESGRRQARSQAPEEQAGRRPRQQRRAGTQRRRRRRRPGQGRDRGGSGPSAGCEPGGGRLAERGGRPADSPGRRQRSPGRWRRGGGGTRRGEARAAGTSARPPGGRDEGWGEEGKRGGGLVVPSALSSLPFAGPGVGGAGERPPGAAGMGEAPAPRPLWGKGGAAPCREPPAAGSAPQAPPSRRS